MPRKKTLQAGQSGVRDFRHAEARRKNNPPAGVAPTYEVQERQTKTYAYDPHLDLQLVWAGKAEHTSFDVDVVSLHIHERISTRAILDAVRRVGRVAVFGDTLRYIRYHEDFPVRPLSNLWDGLGGAANPLYAVQTNEEVIARCILLTTDPGDLIFDPTCGSGTTAYCAEKWGRRWITCDTSRVALAIARQRLMTAKYDYYELRDPERGPAGGFFYETVPHITLESIAKNTEIDTIAAKYQPQIDQALSELNAALGKEWKEWEVPPCRGRPCVCPERVR